MIAFGALTRLENELIAIAGVAEALTLIGVSPDIGNGTKALSYLGQQLTLHREEAREAFDEIFEAMKKPATPAAAP